MELFKPGKTYDFMRFRKYWIALSVFLTLGSLVLLFFPGPNYGTDFKGGTEIEVAFLKATDGSEVRQAVTKRGLFSEPDVVQVADPRQAWRYLIRVQEVSNVDEISKNAIKVALCLGIDADSDACPANARATEVKFSAGGDKVSVRYDVSPDLAKVGEQLGKVANVKLRSTTNSIQVVNPRDHRVEIQLQSKGDQLLDVF